MNKKKNLTLAIDQGLLKQAKHLAIERDVAVSELVAQLLKKALDESGLAQRKQNAIRLLRKGIKLGGKPLTRDQIYQRGAKEE